MMKFSSKYGISQISTGAAFLGIVGAAGLFLVQQYKQEKLRTAMARDLERLDRELSKLRSEIQLLQTTASSANIQCKRSRKSSRSTKKSSSILSTKTDEYLSASNYDSSDLEFYDVSDEDIEAKVTNLDLLLVEYDKKLTSENVEEIENALKELEDLCIEYPENADLLFRIGKAHYKVLSRSNDKEFKQQRIAKGINACEVALGLAPDHSEVHKWYAVLIGVRADFQSIQERISDGKLFKKHVDIAVSINPNDEALHFMLGRFYYEIAALKWYEKKVAAALSGEPMQGSYEDAYNCFLEAENCANFEWKENRLMLAKCKIGLNQYKEAVEWLEKAKSSKNGIGVDEVLDEEINQLLNKYKNYS
ncbi:hypothetical protein GWI33_010524 [Rhynchophorus ferrugineus]|uniref:Regulator of microtubule dynamics protein 1 n=1 Tax=Rhynchophorus ferrugineus TaxID=354439 RepID=A0A834MM97_RHYFE|nr:hypothetical protein GWI33_010524 [Rhynchophorus ferrugineus]